MNRYDIQSMNVQTWSRVFVVSVTFVFTHPNVTKRLSMTLSAIMSLILRLGAISIGQKSFKVRLMSSLALEKIGHRIFIIETKTFIKFYFSENRENFYNKNSFIMVPMNIFSNFHKIKDTIKNVHSLIAMIFLVFLTANVLSKKVFIGHSQIAKFAIKLTRRRPVD